MLLAYAEHGRHDTALIVREYTWERLAQRLARVDVGDKDGSYILRGGKLKQLRRNTDNLLEAELLVIDGDGSFDPDTGELITGIDPDEPDEKKRIKGNCVPIEQARDALDALGYRYIIHTTFTNTPGILNKWRAYIPAKMRNEGELNACVKMVLEQLHAKGCLVVGVTEMTTWAQPWYLPRSKPKYLDAYRCFASLNGSDVNVKAAVAVAAQLRASEEAVLAAREPVTSPAVNDGDSIIKAFNDASSLEWVRGILEANGYRFAFKRGDVYRYISPTSESGMPGVQLFKGAQGDWCTYSHHGAHDPLSHRLSDPFDLFTIFQHGGDRSAAASAARKEAGTAERRIPLTGLGGEEATSAAHPMVKPKEPQHSGPIFVPSDEFAAAWQPAEYLIDGIIQRSYCYSLTSPTGHGKTALIMLMAACIGTGRNFGAAETIPGRVGYFAAENPNDVQARWIGLQEELKFDAAAVWFCPTTIDLETSHEQIAKEAEAAGGFDLIVVDTSQAFFKGEDENSNAQMVTHAKAMRKLTQLPGNPCVVILTHPIKNPAKDNLLPRGGGGFLAEVDGNLTLWNDGGNLVLHHQGKFRGPGFAPVNFTLKPVTPARLKDSRGRQIPTVTVEYVTDEQATTRLVANASDQDKVMILLLSRRGDISIADIASLCNWTSALGLPNKAKVHRLLQQLKEEKLVMKKRNGKYTLTNAGRREISAKAAREGIDAAGDDDDDD